MSEGKQTRNSAVLASFVAYCQANPQQHFWQALLNWSQLPFIYVSDVFPTDIPPDLKGRIVDPYGWEGRNQFRSGKEPERAERA